MGDPAVPRHHVPGVRWIYTTPPPADAPRAVRDAALRDELLIQWDEADARAEDAIRAGMRGQAGRR